MNKQIIYEVAKLHEYFPNRVGIFGSFARDEAFKCINAGLWLPEAVELTTWTTDSDVDILIATDMTRQALVKVLRTVFDDLEVIHKSDHYEQYKMPGIRRTLEFNAIIADTIVKLNVVVIGEAFLKDNKLEDYLLTYQASSLSEVCIVFDHLYTRHHIKWSDAFKDIIDKNQIVINEHPDACTSWYKKKVRKFAKQFKKFLISVPPTPYPKFL